MKKEVLGIVSSLLFLALLYVVHTYIISIGEVLGLIASAVQIVINFLLGK
jgi:hypothetical protein